jgi:hypothetical protein
LIRGYDEGLMDYNINEADLGLTFSVDEVQILYSESNEKIVRNFTVDLKPNGRNIAVTNHNKFEYINLLTGWK